MLVELVKIIGPAIVAFLLGFIAARRRISVRIRSILPSGRARIPGIAVDLPRELLEALNRCHFTGFDRDVEAREDLAMIDRQIRRCRLLLAAAPTALTILTASLEKLPTTLEADKKRDIIARLVGNHIVAIILQGMTRRGSIEWEDPPSTLDRSKLLIPLYEDPIGGGFKGVYGRFILDLPGFRAAPYYNDPSERFTTYKCFYGLAKPDLANLADNVRKAKEELLEDVRLANEIVANGEPLVLKNSHWLVEMHVSNRGGVPVTFSSDATLYVRCGRDFPGLDLKYRPGLKKLADDSEGTKEELPVAERELRTWGVTLDAPNESESGGILIPAGKDLTLKFIATQRIAVDDNGVKCLEFWKERMAAYRTTLRLAPRGFLLRGLVASPWQKL